MAGMGVGASLASLGASQKHEAIQGLAKAADEESKRNAANEQIANALRGSAMGGGASGLTGNMVASAQQAEQRAIAQGLSGIREQDLAAAQAQRDALIAQKQQLFNNTLTTSGMQQVVTIRIWSREGGRAQAAAIMQRIHTLLHQAPLTVTGQTLVSIQFAGSTIILLNDGWTYRGTMIFRAVLQAD